MALRQSGYLQGASAAAPAPARDPSALNQAAPGGNAAGPEQYTGAEKRRSSRYKCEGSAEMREDGKDVRTWATFTDISLHGCYVEAQATYPAGTTLHLKLEANGLKVEAKGTVRVNYPYLGMGIALVEMTEYNRDQLKELLGTISRPAMIMGPGIAAPLPSSGPMGDVPLISDPGAAIQALIAFFENRHMLTREDFLQTLTRSQAGAAKR